MAAAAYTRHIIAEHGDATPVQLAAVRLVRCPAGCGFVGGARVVAGHLREVCPRVVPLRGPVP
eukprot:74114-Prorocentrum_minimum.AAC.1